VLGGPGAMSLQEELVSAEKSWVEFSILIGAVAERLVALAEDEGGEYYFPFEIERCLGALGIVGRKNE
jgi:hypothetical protein